MKVLFVMLVTFLALGFLPSEAVAKPLPPRPKAADVRPPAGESWCSRACVSRLNARGRVKCRVSR